jgi:hypothetical protein
MRSVGLEYRDGTCRSNAADGVGVVEGEPEIPIRPARNGGCPIEGAVSAGFREVRNGKFSDCPRRCKPPDLVGVPSEPEISVRSNPLALVFSDRRHRPLGVAAGVDLNWRPQRDLDLGAGARGPVRAAAALVSPWGSFCNVTQYTPHCLTNSPLGGHARPWY